MKSRRATLVTSLAAVTALAIASQGGETRAELVTEGEGKAQKLDPSQFTKDQQADYDLFASKCTKCHAMSRPIAALKTGKTPVTGGVFDSDEIKKYVVKMMRKPNSGITKADAKRIISFLVEARKLAKKT